MSVALGNEIREDSHSGHHIAPVIVAGSKFIAVSIFRPQDRIGHAAVITAGCNFEMLTGS